MPQDYEWIGWHLCVVDAGMQPRNVGIILAAYIKGGIITFVTRNGSFSYTNRITNVIGHCKFYQGKGDCFALLCPNRSEQ